MRSAHAIDTEIHVGETKNNAVNQDTRLLTLNVDYNIQLFASHLPNKGWNNFITLLSRVALLTSFFFFHFFFQIRLKLPKHATAREHNVISMGIHAKIVSDQRVHFSGNNSPAKRTRIKK